MEMNQLIERDPEKLGGTPVFFGTRVPIKNLFVIWRVVKVSTFFLTTSQRLHVNRS
jgi:uncharacterized protein (DUF433 family)